MHFFVLLLQGGALLLTLTKCHRLFTYRLLLDNLISVTENKLLRSILKRFAQNLQIQSTFIKKLEIFVLIIVFIFLLQSTNVVTIEDADDQNSDVFVET